MPPADPVAAKAFAVLETHCARCHQGRPGAHGAPAASFGRIPHLEALARDPGFVVPGNPDASRLYTFILRRLMPFDVYQQHAKREEPTGDDLQALRAWIAGLPRSEACTDRGLLAPEELVAVLASAADAAGQQALRLRFLSIAHLYNACQSEDDLQLSRQALAALVKAMQPTSGAVELVPLDRNATLFKIDLDQLGWGAEEWERMVAASPNPAGRFLHLPKELKQRLGSGTPVVKADWFAHRALREQGQVTPADDRDAKSAASGAGMRPADIGSGPTFDGVGPLAALARLHRRPLSWRELAGELMITKPALEALGASQEHGELVRRALHGIVMRAEVDAGFPSLLAALGMPRVEGSGAAIPSAAAESEGGVLAVARGAPRIEIAADKAVYAKGDLLTLTVRTSRDCHLTLVSIDRRGRGTVLYPNDFEPDGHLTAGQTLTLPGASAGYAFRLREAGRETIVAICNPSGPGVDGIRHDFERQRFTDLGDYGTFLAQAFDAERGERQPGRRGGQGPLQRERERRQAREPASPVEGRSRPEIIAREAISFEVR